MPDVTIVTDHPATADNLTEADYRDIYAEVRQKMTLRKFVAVAGTHYSIAWWSQFERGEKGLTYHAKAALRRLVGLPALPPPVDVALDGAVDADATICRIGDERPARRVLLFAGDDSVTVHWFGSAPDPLVVGAATAATGIVTPVTSQRKRAALWRPVLPVEWRKRASDAGVDIRAAVIAAIEKGESEK